MNIIIGNIKARMRELRLTQNDLATSTGLAFGTINRILNEKQKLSDNNLCKIAEAIDMTVEELSNPEDSLNNNVQGYLQFGSEIVHITSYAQLKKWIKDHEELINALPKQAKSILSTERKNAKSLVLEDINIDKQYFYQNKEIDASKVETWSFRKTDDVRDDISISLGNMSKGYDFEVYGHTFSNSEALYICGMFSDNIPKHIFIQEKLLKAKSGYDAKKVVRRQYEEDYGRKDWNEFNVEWMKWVVWQKIQSNIAFKELLLSIPEHSYIIENSTHQKGSTAIFWGMMNKQLEDARAVVEKYVAYNNPLVKKNELVQLQTVERNKINHIGTWIGVNMMGTILKHFQLCLIHNEEPVIDYDLLNSKDIYLFEQKIIFK